MMSLDELVERIKGFTGAARGHRAGARGCVDACICSQCGCVAEGASPWPASSLRLASWSCAFGSNAWGGQSDRGWAEAARGRGVGAWQEGGAARGEAVQTLLEQVLRTRGPTEAKFHQGWAPAALEVPRVVVTTVRCEKGNVMKC